MHQLDKEVGNNKAQPTLHAYYTPALPHQIHRNAGQASEFQDNAEPPLDMDRYSSRRNKAAVCDVAHTIYQSEKRILEGVTTTDLTIQRRRLSNLQRLDDTRALLASVHVAKAAGRLQRGQQVAEGHQTAGDVLL